MANFIIGAILGIAALLLLLSTMAKINERIIKKEVGEDFDVVIISKSEMEKYKEYRNKNCVEKSENENK